MKNIDKNTLSTPGGAKWPTANPARMRFRHFMLLVSFIMVVLLPIGIIYWYLQHRTADQFASTLGFTVQQADNSTTAVELIGGITSLGGDSTKNTDILFEFIQSQQLVSLIEKELILSELFSKPIDDPIFRYNPDGSIEDLVKFWNRMVSIYYDTKTGLIEIRILAFAPDDAHRIANEIVHQGSLMINRLNSISQEDTTRYAEEELARSVDRLKTARQSLVQFQTINQIVDPNADLQGQMGLLNSLQQRMADALIELDLLADVTRDGDSRLELVRRKIDVIADHIAEERRKLVISDNSNNAFSSLIGEFEALRVDLQFAEQAYIGALSTFDNAVAEARHKSTYLAAYIEPTIAQRSEYPKRGAIISLSTVFLFLLWAIMVLIIYSVRDRR